MIVDLHKSGVDPIFASQRSIDRQRWSGIHRKQTREICKRVTVGAQPRQLRAQCGYRTGCLSSIAGGDQILCCGADTRRRDRNLVLNRITHAVALFLEVEEVKKSLLSDRAAKTAAELFQL